MRIYNELLRKKDIEISEEAKLNIYHFIDNKNDEYLKKLKKYFSDEFYYNEIGIYLYLYELKKFCETKKDKEYVKENLIERLQNILFDNDDNNYCDVTKSCILPNNKIKAYTLLSKIIPIKSLKEKFMIKAAEYDHIPSKYTLAKYYDDNNELEKALKYYKEGAFLGDSAAIKKMIEYYHSNNDIVNEEQMLLCGLEISTSYIEQYIDLINRTNNKEYAKRLFYYLLNSLMCFYTEINHLADIYYEGNDSFFSKLCAYLLYESCEDNKYQEKIESLKESILNECHYAVKKEAEKIQQAQLKKEQEEQEKKLRKEKELEARARKLKEEQEAIERQKKEREELKQKTLRYLVSLNDLEKIREAIVSNLTILPLLKELIDDKNEQAKTIIEKCYKDNKLSPKEEKMFYETRLNQYLSYIFATTYKYHNKSKYVLDLIDLYSNFYVNEAIYELGGNSDYVLNDPITRSIIEQKARSTQKYYLIELLLKYYKNDEKKVLEYRFMLANQNDQTSIIEIINYYLSNDLPVDKRYIDTVMRFDDVEGYNNFNMIIDTQIARFYKYGHIKWRKSKKINPTVVYYIYRQAANIYGNKAVEKFAALELAKCFEEGYGVEVSKNKTAELYAKYKPTPKVEEKQKTHLEKYIEERNKITREIFKKYPCKEYDYLCEHDKEYAKLIFDKCITWNEDSIELQLKRRDYLLSIGLTMQEIYGKAGIIVESNIKDLVASKEAEIKRKQEEKERLRLEKIKQVQLEKQKKIEEEKAASLAKQKAQENTIKPVETSSKSVQKPIVKEETKVEKSITKPIEQLKKSADELLKELRIKYNAPTKPEYSKEIHGSLRNFEKNIMKEYYQKEEEYRKKLLSIAPDIKSGDSDSYKDFYYNIYKFSKSNGYKHEYSNYYNNIHKNGKEGISLEMFDIALTSLIENKYSMEEVKVHVEKFYKIKEIYCLERLVLGLPTTISELKVTLTVGYILYDKVDSSYLKAHEEFENSELSKIITWHEYSDSSKSEIGASIYVDNYNDELQNKFNRQDAKDALKKKLFSEVRNLFNQYNIFYNEVMERDGVTRTIPLRFKELSTTIKWELFN